MSQPEEHRESGGNRKGKTSNHGSASVMAGRSQGGSLKERIFGGKLFVEALRPYLEKDRNRAELDAVDLFRELFGYVDLKDSRPWDYSVGRPKYPTAHGFHTDNWKCSLALGPAFNLPRTRPSESNHTSLATEGNVFLFGGCTSTEETTVAFEFEGGNDYSLRRPANPTIPLRWCDLGDPSEVSHLDLEPIAYAYEGIGPRRTTPWPVAEFDLATGALTDYKRSESGPESIEVAGERVKLPKTNYLYITRMPNFLDSSFDPVRPADSGFMLLLSGSNGIGTRASQLLATPKGKEALSAAYQKVSRSEAFQVLLVANDIRQVDDYHVFTNVDYKDAVSLDNYLSPEIYRRAHEKAMRRLSSASASDDLAESDD